MKNRPEHTASQLAINDPALGARVCWYHYKEGLTQQEIADRIGLSRATVNKIIAEARDAGLVRVEINSPIAPCLDLESRLAQTFDLDDVLVVPAPAKPEDSYRVVGLAAGAYVSRRLAAKAVLGITWGTTLHYAAQSLEQRSGSGISVVSLSGGLARSTVINPYENAALFARLLNADCYYLTAPMIVENRSLKEAMLGSDSIKTVLQMARKTDMALLTAVDLSANAQIMAHGVLTDRMRRDLLKAGAVGNVCDHYVDRDGNVIEHEINGRTVSVPLDLVRRIPKRVLAGGGDFKVDILRACLKARICNVLITEERAAEGLLASPSG